MSQRGRQVPSTSLQPPSSEHHHNTRTLDSQCRHAYLTKALTRPTASLIDFGFRRGPLTFNGISADRFPVPRGMNLRDRPQVLRWRSDWCAGLTLQGRRKLEHGSGGADGTNHGKSFPKISSQASTSGVSDGCQ